MLEYASEKYANPIFKLRVGVDSKVTILDHEDPPATHPGKVHEIKFEAKDGLTFYACTNTIDELFQWYHAFRIVILAVTEKLPFEEARETLEERDKKENEPVVAEKRKRTITMADAVRLARTNFAEVFAFGDGAAGQLGCGEEVGGGKSSPQKVPAFHVQPSPRAIACGRNFSAVISYNDKVMVWGRNSHGQLGLRELKTSLRPVVVPALRSQKVRSLACGSHHIVIANTQGEVYTWGSNKYGQCGVGKTAISVDNLNDTEAAMSALGTATIPQPTLLTQFGVSGTLRPGIPPGTLIERVCAGVDATAAISSTGSVFVWGNNKEGKLGLGSDLLGHAVGSPQQPLFLDNNDRRHNFRFVKVAFSTHFSLWLSVPKCIEGIVLENQELGAVLQRRQSVHPGKATQSSSSVGSQANSEDGVAEEIVKTIEKAKEEIDVSEILPLIQWDPWFPGTFEGRLHISGRVGITMEKFESTKNMYASLRNSKEFAKQPIVSDIAAGIQHGAIISRGRIFTIGFGWLGLVDDDGNELPNKDIKDQIVKDCSVIPIKEAPSLGAAQVASDAALVTRLQLESLVNVAVGDCHTIAVSSKGRMYGWGQCAHGQLGTGKYLPRSIPFTNTPVASVKGFHIVGIAACGSFTLALAHRGDPRGESRDRMVVRKACEIWWNKMITRVKNSKNLNLWNKMPTRTFTGTILEVDNIDKEQQMWVINQTVDEIGAKYGISQESLVNDRTENVRRLDLTPLKEVKSEGKDSKGQSNRKPDEKAPTSEVSADTDTTVHAKDSKKRQDEEDEEGSSESHSSEGCDAWESESSENEAMDDQVEDSNDQFKDSSDEVKQGMSLAERRQQRRKTIKETVRKSIAEGEQINIDAALNKLAGA